MRIASSVLALLLAIPFSAAEAQRCPLTGVYYLVRDRDGTLLDETELRALVERSPPPVGDDVGMFVGVVTAAADGAYGLAGSPTIPVLYFRGVTDNCQLYLTEATLVQGRRRMRLVFNLTLPLPASSRAADALLPHRPSDAPPLRVVDSPRFQDGTFELDVGRWSAGYKFAPSIPAIAAEFWREVPGAD